jgi:hypothetical protein
MGTLLISATVLACMAEFQEMRNVPISRLS